MIKFYRIFSYTVHLIASVYILAELFGLMSGHPTLLLFEDFIIFTFIIIATGISFAFCRQTHSLPFTSAHRFEIIDSREIRKNLKRKDFNVNILYGNLIIGAVISAFMIVSIVSDPIDLLDDLERMVSNALILIYGLIQVHFSLIIRKKIGQ